ncbi:MAG TPA: aspartate-semialdehyde dehydrogenase [Abditibacteriaceae bacterium]|nr:aspartate-semialdehyde dehydrogenase [Abditibacteriaceae bacterium]
MTKKRVAVIGATGIAGQQFIAALPNHPDFEIAVLAASSRSAGKSYLDALREPSGAIGWWCDEPLNEDIARMPVVDAEDFDAASVDIVFTAVESDAAKTIEPRYAATTPVVSTASAFRYFDDVPILIPGVNNDHARLLRRQQNERGWKGFVTPIPNCTTTGLAMTLKPLYDAFGIEGVVMTSMQAMSGAGRRGGVLGLDAMENVIPYISGEEEKVQKETQKILGAISDNGIGAADFPVSATCTRVGVLDGHTEAVYVATHQPCSAGDAARVMRDFTGGLEGLPTAPRPLIFVHDDPFRPQPRRDRNMNDGMTTVVGRLREEKALGTHGVKYVLVSHNTKMGAAKGAILVAELLVRDGYIR